MVFTKKNGESVAVVARAGPGPLRLGSAPDRGHLGVKFKLLLHWSRVVTLNLRRSASGDS